MRRVLETEGFSIEAFDTAEAFLASGAASRVACLVLDIQLPGISGIELHQQLVSSGNEVPTIFVTARDELLGLAAQKTRYCLVKPFPSEALIQAVNRTIHLGDYR